MTTAVVVDADDLERLAFAHQASITLHADWAYAHIDGTTYKAALAPIAPGRRVRREVG